jgi:lipoprotein LenA
MKRLFLSFGVVLALLAACSQQPASEEETAEKNQEPQKVYAKWDNRVYKDKDLKEIVAVLSKCESVTKLGEEEVTVSSGSKEETFKVYHIKLADGVEAYAKENLFALKTIVFTADSTDCFVRPTMDSRLYYKIPLGTLGFITEEGDDGWVKIWIGKVDDGGKEKWVTDQWVQAGYSDEIELIRDAKLYEKALETLDKNPEEGIAALKEINENSATFFARLASEKIPDNTSVE